MAENAKKIYFPEITSRIFHIPSFDRTIKVWETGTQSLLESIPFPDHAMCATVSADGQLLAVGGEWGYWGLWEIASRRLLLAKTNFSGVVGITFDRKGANLALVADDVVEIWDIASRRKLVTRVRNSLPEDGFLHGVAFLPDGRRLAYASGDSRILLYNLDSGSEIQVGKSVGGDALSLAVSPDGRTLVSSDKGMIIVWDIAGTLPPRYLTNHLEQIACVCFSPDGKLLVRCNIDF